MHTEAIREYKTLEEFKNKDLEAYECLIEYFHAEEAEEDFDEDDFNSLIDFIKEISCNVEESIDSCYIMETYRSKLIDRKFCFEVYGQSYRKDHCVCDEEMATNITVIDVNQEKELARQKANANANESDIKWHTFFNEKTIEQIKEALLKIKYPDKL